MTTLMPPPQAVEAASAADAACLAHSLQLAVERRPDLDLAVFPRLFERCPSARPLFNVFSPDFAPHGCATMVYSILELLQDQAAGKGYVAGYAQQLAAEHRGFGVHDPAHYAQVLDALLDVLASALGPDWTPEVAQAWQRQARTLQAHLTGA